MSYYTGTIFEIAMPELGAACGGGGRYDKMVGKFTGQDVPACGFSIGFERIVLLLMESGFTVPMQRPKVAYLIEKGYPADKLVDVIAKAQEERQAGKQVLVVRMNKNKKFQKEKLAAEGYKDIVEFFNNQIIRNGNAIAKTMAFFFLLREKTLKNSTSWCKIKKVSKQDLLQ